MSEPEKATINCLRLDLDEYTSRNDQAIQRLDSPAVGLVNVDDPLVRPNLELLTRFLINKRPTKHGVPLNPRRQWNRALDFGVGAFGMIHDLPCRGIEGDMVISFETNTDPIDGHMPPFLYFSILRLRTRIEHTSLPEGTNSPPWFDASSNPHSRSPEAYKPENSNKGIARDLGKRSVDIHFGESNRKLFCEVFCYDLLAHSSDFIPIFSLIPQLCRPMPSDDYSNTEK